MSQELIIKDTGILAKVEIDTQISTAKAYPRNAKRAIEYATELATMDDETAQSCFYVLPRKEKDGTKKEIKGGSIRLAEIMANAWGNLHAATRIVENDGMHITAEGVAWDLETNVRMVMQNKVSIQFKSKDGKGTYQANSDMQTVLSNAAAAKALRNAIFKVIPKALVDRVLENAMKHLVGDVKRLNGKVNATIEKLVKMGLDKDKIFEFYNKKSTSEFTEEEFTSLIGIGTALKDKMIKLEDVFSSQMEETKVSAIDRIDQLLQDKKSEVIDNKTGEITNSSNVPLTEYDKVKKQLLNAKSMDTLAIAADLIQTVDEEKREELTTIYRQRVEEFK